MSGDRPPAPGRQGAEAAHEDAAADFARMLEEIRAEGAVAFDAGMRELWWSVERVDPVDPPGGVSAEAAGPYAAVSDQRLADFGGMAADVRADLARTAGAAGPESQALRALVAQVSQVLRPYAFDALAPGAFGLEPHEADLPPWLRPPWASGEASVVLPLVWLPLALYVRSTLHLYELLQRWRSCAGGLGSDGWRAVLDADGRPYAYLAFAVTAALQVLHTARGAFGGDFPVALLASSPPPEDGSFNGYPMADALAVAPLLFRGLWVGPDIDERAALFPVAPQSFSRSAAGMAKVLSFYAGVSGSRPAQLAAEHGHVLVLVARADWRDLDFLGMPLQFFDGPREHGSELEVVFPPFVGYELEEDVRLTSSELVDIGAGADALASRWGVPELPKLLMSLLRREPLSADDAAGAGLSPGDLDHLRRLRPRVSVLFVRRIVLASPLRQVFHERARPLYDFGAE